MSIPKVLVAPDSFKGSLSAVAVANALRNGLSRCLPQTSITVQPMADGGEGTGAILEALGGERVPAASATIYGAPVQRHWIRWQRMALVEASVGSQFVSPPNRQGSSEHTTSVGTGMLIAAALADPAIDEVMVALGGTGSTDGGLGMLMALGGQFMDGDGRFVTPFGDNLSRVSQCVLPRMSKPLMGLYDVGVPLLGQRGAVVQFGLQKGILPGDIKRVEDAMGHYAHCVQGSAGPDWANVPGAGAAGGMGFGILAMGGRLQSGAEVVAQWGTLDRHISAADWIITGEGKIDSQTVEGKVVGTVVRQAARHGKPVIAVVGSRDEDLTQLHQMGLTFVLPLVPGPMSLSDAMKNAEPLIIMVGEELGWLIKRQCP
ncbi:MAG: glycerate kinase [Sulfobacillus benefaciens]|uniref:Glycerate kinase n=1 Tax=Sulfobacillus benefaciens TaxID=453960 RepID=A0A2T2X832_9FIRM|nr:MAG: glycerate kinase [Sulfobacillus benefaciens]